MNFIVAAILISLNPENDKFLVQSILKKLDDFTILDKSFEKNCFWIFVYIM